MPVLISTGICALAYMPSGVCVCVRARVCVCACALGRAGPQSRNTATLRLQVADAA